MRESRESFKGLSIALFTILNAQKRYLGHIKTARKGDTLLHKILSLL